MRHLIAATGLAFALSVFPANAADVAEPAPTPDPACVAAAVKCWYMVFAIGDAPSRQLIFVNARAQSGADGATKSEMLHVFEQGTDARFIVYDLDVRCDAGQARVAGGYLASPDGRLVNLGSLAPSARQNAPFSDRAVPLVCDPTVAANPGKHFVLFAGNMFRPADLDAMVRRWLLGQSLKPD